MKVYQVVDDSIPVLITSDKIKALEKLYELSKKYNDKQDWFRIDELELK